MSKKVTPMSHMHFYTHLNAVLFVKLDSPKRINTLNTIKLTAQEQQKEARHFSRCEKPTSRSNCLRKRLFDLR